MQHGEAFLRDVRELGEILENARRQREPQHEAMQRKLDRLADSIRADLDGWYEGGDIFGSWLVACALGATADRA